MSVEALSWAFKQTVKDPTAKLVLIALCNAYNDESGKCHPSHAKIAAIADCSTRTVIRKLKYLSEHGWVQIVPTFNKSGRTSNSYYITDISDDDSLSYTPSVSDNLSGEVSDTPVTGVGDTVVTGIRKGTVSSCNRKKKNKQKKPIDFLREVLSEESAQAVIDHRKTIKKPMSSRAAELLAQQFAKTPNPDLAADQMILKGWQGFIQHGFQKRN